MPIHPTTSKQSTAKVASIKKKPLHAAQLDEASRKLQTDGPVAAFPEATFDRDAVTDPALPKPAQRPKRGNDPNYQPLHAVQIAEALLKLKTAAAVAGLSEATLRRKEKEDPTFPRLIRLGARCTRIRAGELTAWLAAQGASPVKVS